MSKNSNKMPTVDVFAAEIAELDDETFGPFVEKYIGIPEHTPSEDEVFEYLEQNGLLKKMVDASPSVANGFMKIRKKGFKYRVQILHREGVYRVDDDCDSLEEAVKRKLHNVIGSIRASRR